MKHHYIYRVEDRTTGEFYWGSRSCNCDPKNDFYLGSFRVWKPNRENLIKTTIIEYDTREEANKAEQIVIKYYIDKTKFPLNRNYHIPSIGFYTVGMKRPELSKFNTLTKKGKPLTEEHKKKISEHGGNVAYWEGKKNKEQSERMKGNSCFKGKHHTEEQKRKQSERMKGRTPWNKGLKSKNIKQ